MKYLISFGLLLLLSCNKQDDSINGRIHIRTSADPNVFHGMLWFDNINHLQRYYYFLDTLLANPNVFDIDSMLALYEENFDYTSLRSVLYEDSFTDADTARSTTNCVVDEVRQSILNEDYSVRVGDSIYFKYSSNQVYFMHMDSSNLIELFRDAPKGGTIDTIPFELLFEGVNLISPTKVLYIDVADSIINPPIIPRSPPFIMDAALSADNCDPFHIRFEARIRDEGAIIFPFFRIGNFTITFGDGTSDARNNTNNAVFLHTYNSIGLKTAHIHGVFSWDDHGQTRTEMFDRNLDVDIGNLDCGVVKEQYPDPDWKDNGTIGMRSLIWYANDIFGQDYGCRTNSYKKIGNDWKKKDAAIVYARVDGDWRDRFTCEVVDNVYVSQSKTNARNVRVSERIAGHCNFDPLKPDNINCVSIFNGDVQTAHAVHPYNNGAILSTALELDPCH